MYYMKTDFLGNVNYFIVNENGVRNLERADAVDWDSYEGWVERYRGYMIDCFTVLTQDEYETDVFIESL